MSFLCVPTMCIHISLNTICKCNIRVTDRQSHKWKQQCAMHHAEVQSTLIHENNQVLMIEMMQK